MNSVDIMQGHMGMMHQSPTLSPTSNNQLLAQQQTYLQYTQQPNSRKIKTLNVNNQNNFKKTPSQNQTQSQFGSRLSQNTNMTNNQSMKKNST